jgi:hypothetical protein
VGQPEQFAKQTFAEETVLVTRGAVCWQDPPEMGLTKVQGDGLLIVERPNDLAALPLPWCEARWHDELFVELKMPGDHLDVRAVERALLRRQARQVQRVEETEPTWEGQEPLWLVAPHIPRMLGRLREVRPLGAGCYAVGPSAFPFLWIAANELPLDDALVPFLVARSGRALVEFACWVVDRRPLEWFTSMVQFTTMKAEVSESLMRRLAPTDDPELQARRDHIMRLLLPMWGESLRREIVEEGVLLEARRMLRRILTRRGCKLTLEDEACIDACSNHETLERWLEQAITAASTAEALR